MNLHCILIKFPYLEQCSITKAVSTFIVVWTITVFAGIMAPRTHGNVWCRVSCWISPVGTLDFTLSLPQPQIWGAFCGRMNTAYIISFNTTKVESDKWDYWRLTTWLETNNKQQNLWKNFNIVECIWKFLVVPQLWEHDQKIHRAKM